MREKRKKVTIKLFIQVKNDEIKFPLSKTSEMKCYQSIFFEILDGKTCSDKNSRFDQLSSKKKEAEGSIW